MVKTSQLSTVAAPASADFFPLVDADGNYTGRISLLALLTFMQAQTTSNPYKFSAYKSGSNQTITTASPQTIVYDVESYDTNGNFSGNTYTVPVSGFYFLTMGHQVSAAASLTRSLVSIYINGVQAREMASLGSSSSNTSNSVTDVYYLSAGQTITFRAQSVGASYTSVLGQPYNWCSGYCVVQV